MTPGASKRPERIFDRFFEASSMFPRRGPNPPGFFDSLARPVFRSSSRFFWLCPKLLDRCSPGFLRAFDVFWVSEAARGGFRSLRRLFGVASGSSKALRSASRLLDRGLRGLRRLFEALRSSSTALRGSSNSSSLLEVVRSRFFEIRRCLRWFSALRSSS